MNYSTQSSRLSSLLIRLKNDRTITHQDYQIYCEHLINDNQELYLLFQNYEDGLSEQNFLRGLQLLIKDDDKGLQAYIDNAKTLKQQIKKGIKERFSEIKSEMLKVFQTAFEAQKNPQKTIEFVKTILQLFFISDYFILETDQNIHQISQLTRLKHTLPDLQINSYVNKLANDVIYTTDQSIQKLIKVELPVYHIKVDKTLFFCNFSPLVHQSYKDHFANSKIVSKLIDIICTGTKILATSKIITIRQDLLNGISQTIGLLIYRFMFEAALVIAEFTCTEQIVYNQNELDVCPAIYLQLTTDLQRINIKINAKSSKMVTNSMEKIFAKSVRKYRKKFIYINSQIDYFQKISQFNENVMCLFFNHLLQLYYLTYQWNHSQFVDKYYLNEPIEFRVPIYELFSKNPSILDSLRQCIEQELDHLECNDGLYKYSIQISRGYNKKIKHLSIYLYNLQIKRSLKELMSIFRSKVRILQHLRTATSAFKSKQMLMTNKHFHNSALVLYLPDQDRQKLNNETTFSTVNLDLYRRESGKSKKKSMLHQNQKLIALEQFRPKQILEEETLKQRLLSYDFDLLSQEDNKIEIAYNLFRMCKYNLIEEQTFANFITLLRQKYNKRKNPFHNFVHGLQVMHGCYLLAYNDKLSQFFTELQKFALVFSGLCHDVAHTGTTNIFEVNAQTKLAIRYNDRSVLENHHVCQTYRILENEACDIFKKITKEERLQIRKYFINNVLCTDNKNHFTILNDLEIKIKQYQTDKDTFKNEDNLLILSGFVIHACDFSGAVKPYDLARAWSEKLKEEFQAQSQLEQIMGIPQTPYLKGLDNEITFAKNEAGFLKVIVKPLWDTLNIFTNGSLIEQVKNVNGSIKKYEEIAAQNE